MSGTSVNSLNSKPRMWAFWLAIASLVGAIGVHIYLFFHHYEQKFGLEEADSLCNINEKVSCAVASASEYSELFGIPIAVLGAIINGILLALFICARWPLLKQTTQEKLPNVIRFISLGILGTSVVMGIISITILNSICPFCVAAYVLSIITFISTMLYFGGSFTFNPGDFVYLGAIAAATFALGFVVHSGQLQKYGGVKLEKFVQEQFLDWQSQKTHKIEAFEPIQFNQQASAKMQIVEFADYLCPHCKSAFPKLHNFVKARSDVSLKFQAYPLDGACNKSIPNDYGGARCVLARLAHCANKQEKGWQTQKWIFSQQAELARKKNIKDSINEAAVAVNLDKVQLNECIDAESTHQAILRQAELGNNLGIRGTPTIFVNGKKVHGVTVPILQKLYKSIK